VTNAFLAASIRASTEGLGAYGNDLITRQAVAVLRRNFGQASEVFFGPTGTFVNILGCSLLARPAKILATPNSHLVIMESGGPEIIAHSTFAAPKVVNGKIDVAELTGSRFEGVDILHVTQATEYGTVYSLDELRAIGEFCSARGILFGMDGARLPHAAVALGEELQAITTDVGIDYLTLGTAKCGGSNGNVLIIPDRVRTESKGNALISEPRLYELIKLRGGTQSMMWQISSQFVALYEGDLWQRNVSHTVKLAAQMRDGLESEGIRTAFPAETNAIFLKVGEDGQERLGRHWNFFRWLTDPSLVRFMFSFNTPEDLVPQLVRDIVALRDDGFLDC
jgi:threonine aldolase